MSQRLLFYIWTIGNMYVVSEQKFNLYSTGNYEQDTHCILYYVRDDLRGYSKWGGYRFTHQFIPYCLRSSEENIDSLDMSNTKNSNLTFEEIKDKNITSEQLLFWSASIDLAEQYQIFLTNISQWLLPTKNLLFYNCTLPWFGPFCQFAFDPLSDKSLDEIIFLNFESKLEIESNEVTCYEHLNCKTSWICLDWREICDRKVDCFDGADESNCWQLEINECDKNEYRCHNGQCIPEEFFRDGEMNPDCLDRTDEIIALYTATCHGDPAFRCEEHTCSPVAYPLPYSYRMNTHDRRGDCINGRNNLLLKDNCSNAMSCLMFGTVSNSYDWCKKFCSKEICVNDYCPSFIDFFSSSYILGHVRLVYNRTNLPIKADTFLLPDYVCYNESLCIDFLPPTVYLNDLSCRYLYELNLDKLWSFQYPLRLDTFAESVSRRFYGCLIVPNEIYHCHYSSMYQCHNSTKCVSRHRLVDGFGDCPLKDDENVEHSCSLDDARFRSICSMRENKICFAPFFGIVQTSGCDEKSDEVILGSDVYDKDIYFPRICDGKPDLMVMIIDEQNETDETGCEKWSCNNTYTRCDGFWSCKDGADEINCPNSVCPEFYHSCVFPNDPKKLSCLPLNQSGNGIVDCLGATDERKTCQKISMATVFYSWQCLNHTQCVDPSNLCDGYKTCPFYDDEQFCSSMTSLRYTNCAYQISRTLTSVENFFCDFLWSETKRLPIPFFKLSNIPAYPSYLTADNKLVSTSTKTKSQLIEKKQMIEIKDINFPRCKRGLPIFIRTTNNTLQKHCLCPPSYYGDTCQYQNQRVSLTLQIQATSDWLSVSVFIITLSNQEENIESYDHIEYFPARDCKVRYNVYLLYSTRPKNSSKIYSIRIHAFNKLTLKYRVSWIFPIQFSFLPVHRLTVRLIIPYVDNEPIKKCILPCIHGRCFNNVNNRSSIFCQCDPGWFGIQCNIQSTHECASNSLRFDSSICVCPIGRYGPRCHLLQTSCSSQICSSRGQCVHNDQRYPIYNLTKPTCICSEEYFGDDCEHRQTRIDLSFHPQLFIPSSIIVHLITVQKTEKHIRTTILKKLSVDQNVLSFFIEIIFHIGIVEMFDNYYLIILQENDIISANIFTQVVPSHRCLSINELFDETRVNQHVLKRIKSYHIPCEQRLDLVCFYDTLYFCLCDLSRHVNCFEFNHNLTYDCQGHNYCENGGRCFLDDSGCPKSSACSCPDCYFGSRCQFSTKGSSLSLDTIIGYYIRPNISFDQQSTIIKIVVALTIIIFILGVISNLLILFTFRTTTTRKTGCALYLMTTSIISMLATIISTFKFGLFLMSQMGSISNRSFVSIQCISMDFLIRFLLSTNDWLGACVAIERVANILKGVHFDKAKSKQVAKYIILIVFIFNALTYIHDPIHRHLVTDDEERRTWCIVKYSSSLQIFDWIINIIQFSFPFGINLISAFIIILFVARIRSNIQKKQSYKQLLYEQFQHHKHLLISPLILVLLAVPRLVTSFLSGCMKSARNPWLYLIGYFISFFPAILTFFVFILPSDMYTKEFISTMKRMLRL